jgi:soluble lytic murein transglycosylase-like protein
LIPQSIAAFGLAALLYALVARLRGPSYVEGALVEYAPMDDAPTQWVTFTAPATLGAGGSGGVPTVWKWPAAAEPYREAITSAAAASSIPADLLARVLYQESRFRTDIITGRTVSSAGAQGIAQLMPATARELGVDPLNPSQAIDAAARYLRRQLDAFGDWAHALAAYNWGPGNLRRRGLDRAPAETRAYVSEITKDVPV